MLGGALSLTAHIVRTERRLKGATHSFPSRVDGLHGVANGMTRVTRVIRVTSVTRVAHVTRVARVQSRRCVVHGGVGGGGGFGEQLRGTRCARGVC